jgi:lipopolysaccharide transport system ATP-binding protein
VIYLRKGQVVFDGATNEGLQRYEEDSKLQNLHWFGEPAESPITITEAVITDDAGAPTSVVDFGERLRLRIRYAASRLVEQPDFRVGVTRDDETHCATFSTFADEVDIAAIEGNGEIELRTPPIKLASDRYSLRIVVRERGYGTIIAAQLAGSFHVRHDTIVADAFGVFHEQGQWRHITSA